MHRAAQNGSATAVDSGLRSLGVAAEAILVASSGGDVHAAYGWETLTGQPAAEALDDGWLSVLDGASRREVWQTMAEVVRHGQACGGEGRLLDPSRTEVIRWCVRTVKADTGRGSPAGVVISLVRVLDGDGRRPGAFSRFDPVTDGTERAWLRACVRDAMLRLRSDDTLTALLRLQLVTRAGREPVTDLGVAGSAAVAGRFRAVLKPIDVLADEGHGEFLVLCEDLSLRSEGGAIGARLARTLRSPIVVGDRIRRIGAAVGVAITDDGAATADLLIHRAGQAMERARLRGRGPISSFTRAPAGRPAAKRPETFDEAAEATSAPALSRSGTGAA